MKDSPIEVKDYWQQTPKQQVKVLKTVKKLQEDAYAKEQHLVRYKGKLIKPEDYPCRCELESPYMCWEDKHPTVYDWQSGNPCKCKCHTYWEG